MKYISNNTPIGEFKEHFKRWLQEKMATTYGRTRVADKVSLRGRVRQYLLESGKRQVRFSLDEAAPRLRVSGGQLYQTLHGLQSQGELTIVTELIGNTNRQRVIGVDLLSMWDDSRTAIKEVPIKRVEPVPPRPVTDRLRPSAEVSGAVFALDKKEEMPDLPLTMDYVLKKNAVASARNLLKQAGMDESVIAWVEDPLSEEAAKMYSLLLKILPK